MIGNSPPIINANAVITSAHRVTGRRQPRVDQPQNRGDQRAGVEMPIQKTKSVMRKPQKTGHPRPVSPKPNHICVAQATSPQATIVPRNATKPCTRAGRCGTEAAAGRRRGGLRSARFIPASRQIGHLRLGAQVLEQLAAAARLRQPRDLTFRIAEVAEDQRLRRTALDARRLDLPVGDLALFGLRRVLCHRDALHAEGALLHDRRLRAARRRD